MSAARAICKQLFGAKYERIVRSLLVSAILFFLPLWRGRPHHNRPVYPFSDGHGVFSGYHVAGNWLEPSCRNFHGAVYAPISSRRSDAFLCIVLCRLHADYQGAFRAGAAVRGGPVECRADRDGASVRRERMLAGGCVVRHACP